MIKNILLESYSNVLFNNMLEPVAITIIYILRVNFFWVLWLTKTESNNSAIYSDDDWRSITCRRTFPSKWLWISMVHSNKTNSLDVVFLRFGSFPHCCFHSTWLLASGTCSRFWKYSIDSTSTLVEHELTVGKNSKDPSENFSIKFKVDYSSLDYQQHPQN